MNSSSAGPIGFIDSGAGGLTILAPAARALPFERMLYFGDSKNAPYGEKSYEKILDLTKKAADFLLKKGVKCLVIACNTASSVAAEALREQLSIPIIAVEPALKPAQKMAKNGKILVLATKATLALPRFNKSMDAYGEHAEAVGITGLVPLIEQGEISGERVRNCLMPAYSRCPNPQVIVLGCTHYPFVRDEISTLFNAPQIIDGSFGTVNRLKSVLSEKGLLCQRGEGEIEFFSSARGSEKMFERLYGLIK